MAIEVRIEGYDSLEQVAVGGMAAVYKARKISIGKTVAIKVLFPYLASDESFISRFEREARSAATVQHENIVNVVDYGESGGCYYIVMEYYEGKTIADLIKDHQRIPLDIAVSILLDVCLGLEAAHSKEIVHRDIKPANIIYTKQGGIKIADFGLAKKSDAMTVVTQPGKVLGTPAYMSPEQAAGDNVGTQTDIFSLGVVAYEMFCHKRPFEGKSYSEVIEKIQTHQVPSLTHENPLIQPDFENIVEKMLEKDLSRRYSDISDVIIDVERAMEKFEIQRDRRRLKRYMKDPEGYEKAYTEKMVARCLSQGTYFMQKGKTHIADAAQEFKRILYLDPTNDRARKHLAKLMAQYPDENSTVAIDKQTAPGKSGHRGARTEEPASKKAARTRRARPSGESRRRWFVAPLALVLAGAAAFGGWWGWTALRSGGTANAAPVLTTPARLTITEGENLEFEVKVVDADGDDVRLYGDNLPKGAVLSEKGKFTWQVDYAQAGSYALKFFADDGTQVAQAQTLVEVVNKTVALDFKRIKSATARVARRMSLKLQAASAFGQPVTFSLEDAPDGMVLKGDRIVWTPGNGQTGTHRVPVHGTDGIAEADQTLVVRVNAAKDTRRQSAGSGRLDWVLPKLANIYVDGELKVREDTYLSIQLSAGKHVVRAELLDGVTVFEEVVTVKKGSRITLDPPRLVYGRLSVYFLGGVGELWFNGRKFKKQPPFTSAVVPAGTHKVVCNMFRKQDTREITVVVKEGIDTVIEYEVGSEPSVTYEN
ncbi:MAG: serine/threonine-protein kinase [Candidatus Krumholzibacteria bacterium]